MDSKNKENVILVFDRMWVEDQAIDTFLGDQAINAIVLCPDEYKQRCGKVKRVIGFENYLYNENVALAAIDIGREYNVTEVIGTHEFDLIRAGRVRDELGVQGQTKISATAYRDKLVMKQCIRKAELKTACFLPLCDNTDLSHAAALLTLPIVVKPRDGAGSKAVEILRSKDDVSGWSSRNASHLNMMIEEYLNYPMYHIDGLKAGDQILGLTVSKYIGTCLDVKSGNSLGSIQLKDDSVLFQKAKDHASKTINALPGPDVMPFHLEIFVDQNENIIFSEIASRVAGGNIDQIVKLKHNIDLLDVWIKYQLNKDLRDLSNVRSSKEVFGLIIFPPKMGQLQKIPTECNHHDVIKYVVKNKVGDDFSLIRSSADCIAYAIFKGRDEHELESTLKDINKWFYQNLVISGAV
ncbi:MAG: ATP-grasp domain-containing protein [Pseudomonadota bacterium]